MHKRIGVNRSRGRLTRAATHPPFCDEFGHKGWLNKISRAQRHVVRHLRLEIAGSARWSRPLRITFLSDFHTGSHSEDVSRLKLIIDETTSVMPDLALFGGDYVNIQLFGGGRVPPRTIAMILSRLNAPRGILGIQSLEQDLSSCCLLWVRNPDSATPGDTRQPVR
jgi:uncharacterized protein